MTAAAMLRETIEALDEFLDSQGVLLFDQERVPAGSSEGGQFGPGGGNSSRKPSTTRASREKIKERVAKVMDKVRDNRDKSIGVKSQIAEVDRQMDDAVERGDTDHVERLQAKRDDLEDRLSEISSGEEEIDALKDFITGKGGAGRAPAAVVAQELGDALDSKVHDIQTHAIANMPPEDRAELNRLQAEQNANGRKANPEMWDRAVAEGDKRTQSMMRGAGGHFDPEVNAKMEAIKEKARATVKAQTDEIEAVRKQIKHGRITPEMLNNPHVKEVLPTLNWKKIAKTGNPAPDETVSPERPHSEQFAAPGSGGQFAPGGGRVPPSGAESRDERVARIRKGITSGHEGYGEEQLQRWEQSADPKLRDSAAKIRQAIDLDAQRIADEGDPDSVLSPGGQSKYTPETLDKVRELVTKNKDKLREAAGRMRTARAETAKAEAGLEQAEQDELENADRSNRKEKARARAQAQRDLDKARSRESSARAKLEIFKDGVKEKLSRDLVKQHERRTAGHHSESFSDPPPPFPSRPLSIPEQRVDFAGIESVMEKLVASDRAELSRLWDAAVEKLRREVIGWARSETVSPAQILRKLDGMHLDLDEFIARLKEGALRAYAAGQTQAARELEQAGALRLFDAKVSPDDPLSLKNYEGLLEARAFVVARDMEAKVLSSIATTLMNSFDTGATVPQSVAVLDEKFSALAAGQLISPGTPGYDFTQPAVQLTTITTLYNSAMNSGRVALYTDNQEFTKGIEWSAVMDTRTTDTCQAADELKIPFSNPAFLRFSKARHFLCRGVAVPITLVDIGPDPAAYEWSSQAEIDHANDVQAAEFPGWT